jgi:succinoglycan biosynthesis protein ExoV
VKLYSYRDPVGNFGDDLNLWLWPRLVPGIFDVDDGRLFLGIGTLLNHRVPAAARKLVFGTGVGYGEPPSVDANLKIYCVRGPLSARALDLPARFAITDPAILVRKLPLPHHKSGPDLSFMPHHRTMGSIPWARYCRIAGIRLIDPRGPLLTILGNIRSSTFLVTESLHGAIVADALRVPWIPIRIFPMVLDFKWEDWCASMGVPYSPVDSAVLKIRKGFRSRLKGSAKAAILVGRLRQSANSLPRMLSEELAMERVSERLEACLESFRLEQGFDRRS